MKKYITAFAVVAILGTSFVYAQIAEPDPIIIIPGIGASWNTEIILDPTPTPSDEGWRFMPTVKQYDQLITSFEDAGLVEGEDFFIAFYDWRQPNDSSAQNYLMPVIDKALAHSDSGKVDIVAHSMGGLVARAYIQGNAYRNDVDEFMMLGTPNHGSSDVYTLWEGGVVPGNWEQTTKSALTVYLWYTKTVGGSDDNFDAIRTHVRSIQELLPTYDFLVDKETGDEIETEDMLESNVFLQVLNSSGAFDLFTKVDGSITMIAGEGENTVGTIPVVPRTDEDGVLWVDGKPDPLSPEPNDTEGDNRVLLSSAFLEEDVPVVSDATDSLHPLKRLARLFVPTAHAQFFSTQISMAARHGDLPTLAIDRIFSTFDLGTPGTYIPTPEPEEILSFWFASPIDVKVIAPSGASITKTSNTIPGAEYDGADDPLGFKMVVIADPEPGAYSVELTGLADGTYHMGVGSFTDAGDGEQTVTGTTTENQLTTYAVTFDPSNASTSVTISESTPEPEVPEEEPTAQELLAQLISTVEGHGDASTGKQKKVFQLLLVSLRVAEHLLERDRHLPSTLLLKVFDAKVHGLERKNVINQDIASNLLAQSQAIQDAIKSEH